MKNRRLHQLAAFAKNEGQFPESTWNMAVAITATEMHFRPLLFRILEYGYAFFLILLGRDAGSLSVGISQISIRHYTALQGVSQFESLRKLMSAKESIATCCKIVEMLDCDCIEELCNTYNSNSTPFYRRRLAANYSIVCLRENRINNRKASELL